MASVRKADGEAAPCARLRSAGAWGPPQSGRASGRASLQQPPPRSPRPVCLERTLPLRESSRAHCPASARCPLQRP
eukprot:387972-Lingulodinium_polyedra.AAC.1